MDGVAQAPMSAYAAANSLDGLVQQHSARDLAQNKLSDVLSKGKVSEYPEYEYYSYDSKEQSKKSRRKEEDQFEGYFPHRLDKKIRDIEHNDAIFRQDNSGISGWMSSISSIIQIVSMVAGFFNGGNSKTDSPNNPDRVDTAGAAGAIPATEGDDVDLAMGQLMTLGGKYLREVVIWAWEHATSSSAETGVLSPAATASDKVATVATTTTTTAATTTHTTASTTAKAGAVGAAVTTAKATTTSTATTTTTTTTTTTEKPSEPEMTPGFLKKLSAEELETIGLKAVDAGADPAKLQQAFASAQMNGDWTQLEVMIVTALGPGASLSKPVAHSDSDSPLKKLTPEELEALGMKAVDAGAEPSKLQQAFASAQVSGDWTQLEDLISTALGPSAVHGAGGSSSSSGGGILDGLTSGLSNLGNLINPSAGQSVEKIGEAADTAPAATTASSVSSSVVAVSTASPAAAAAAAEAASGLDYYTTMAQQYIKRMDKVIQGPDPNSPSTDPMDESVVTRFIKEFELQHEALALQTNVNNVIYSLNKVVGSGATGESTNLANTGGVSQSANNDNNMGVSTSSSTSSSSGGGGVIDLVARIPQTIGGIAAQALGLVTPGAGAATPAENKLGEGDGGQDNFSEVNGVDPAGPLLLGGLGTAAVGSVLWGMYVNSIENRRRQGKRSLGDKAEEEDVQEVEGKVLQGMISFQERMEACNQKFSSCQEMDKVHTSGKWRKKTQTICQIRRRECMDEILH